MNLNPKSFLLVPLAVLAASVMGSTSAQAQGQEGSRWSFNGDARFRLEFNDNAPGSVDRHRQRLRFRVGGDFIINDELTVGARLITGNPDDPNSPHQDIGNVFNSFDVSLDRLFLRYRPEGVPGLTVWGGKFGQPMYRNPVYGELVWDADVQPEGIAAEYSCNDCTSFDQLGFVLGQYAVLEQSSSADAWATFAAVNFAKNTGVDQKLEGSLNYTFFGDLTPGGSAAITGDLRGNAMTGAELTSDFGIFDAILAYHFGDFVVSAEAINNTRAASGVGDTGMALGAAVKTDMGKFYYQFSSIEQDAVMTVIVQDDFLHATNFDNHMLGWKKKLTERTALHVWVMASEPNELLPGSVDETVYRFRIDLNLNL